MTNLIGISGKIGSGKDTVGKIIQYIADKDEFNYTHPYTTNDFESYVKNKHPNKSNWQIKKFAGKLKQIVSILTGIPIEDLEKEEVKNQVLGEEWTKYYYISINGHKSIYYNTYDEALKDRPKSFNMIEKEELTVRKLLQQIGTDAMRNVIHPNIWVNALFSKYKPIHDSYKSELNDTKYIHTYNYPNWIITDCRFPNEANAVKARQGINIRIERKLYTFKSNIRGVFTDTTPFIGLLKDETLESIPKSNHHSETALDDYQFDYIIDNNGTIKELIDKVEEILIKERII